MSKPYVPGGYTYRYGDVWVESWTDGRTYSVWDSGTRVGKVTRAGNGWLVTLADANNPLEPKFRTLRDAANALARWSDDGDWRWLVP